MTADQVRNSTAFSRFRESIRDSAGEIVFGMSDGVVSIFGLVAGMLATAQSGDVVLLAGATAAIAATVSMMAGVYMDLESDKDEARVEAREREAEIRRNPGGAVDSLITDLKTAGLSEKSLAAVREDLQTDPMMVKQVEDAVACEETPASQKGSLLMHACWMGIADFIAAITPVIPFAFLPVDLAKYACLGGTALLLLLLGIGRAKLGERPMVRTVLETMAIATAAGIAGVVVGLLVS